MASARLREDDAAARPEHAADLGEGLRHVGHVVKCIETQGLVETAGVRVLVHDPGHEAEVQVFHLALQQVRAGLEAIPRGQTEAGLSTGLPAWKAMVYIVLPQGLRNMIPSFVNQFVSLIKDTSLAFIVGVSELTHVATQVNNRTMIYPAEIFAFIAIIYFILCFAFTSLSRWIEEKLAWRKAI